MALASDYEWTEAVNTAYDNCGNWTQPNPPACEYPDTTGDRAIFPWDSTPWTVALISESIGDLVIEGSVDFSPKETDPTVLANGTITIDAAGGDIEVTMSGAALYVP
jgi:hypothetical protein